MPFELDGEDGVVFRSGDRWVSVTLDELRHESYEPLALAPRSIRPPKSLPVSA